MRPGERERLIAYQRTVLADRCVRLVADTDDAYSPAGGLLPCRFTETSAQQLAMSSGMMPGASLVLPADVVIGETDRFRLVERFGEPLDGATDWIQAGALEWGRSTVTVPVRLAGT